MRIGLAMNALKGSVEALAAVAALQRGFEASRLACTCLPMPLADGGDGTLAVVLAQSGGTPQQVPVQNALGEPIEATYALLPDGQTALVEMARASGLAQLGGRQDVLRASSAGTGELIRDALNLGVRRVVLGVGGSATVDGGMGCLRALGVGFLDAEGHPLPEGGGSLDQLARIEPVALPPGVQLEVLCDVTNPPIGEQGAARIYAPQKGAGPAEVERLEHNLAHYFALIARTTGQDVRELPGGGAAGAIAGGLAALLGAQLVPGAPTLIELLGYAAEVPTCDLIITGEGAIDAQTQFGKAPAAIAKVAEAHGVPVIALGGLCRQAAPMFRPLPPFFDCAGSGGAGRSAGQGRGMARSHRLPLGQYAGTGPATLTFLTALEEGMQHV
ncbi:MAG: glycerate kinase [Anaerolineae bacterium]|nr:glycerate kinase [Anaerolineae bacterium]